MHRIPALRRLIIECPSFSCIMPCSDAGLLSLLRSSPDLCVEWLAHQSDSLWFESQLQPLVAQSRGRLMRTVESNGQRVRLRLVRDA